MGEIAATILPSQNAVEAKAPEFDPRCATSRLIPRFGGSELEGEEKRDEERRRRRCGGEGERERSSSIRENVETGSYLRNSVKNPS